MGGWAHHSGPVHARRDLYGTVTRRRPDALRGPPGHVLLREAQRLLLYVRVRRVPREDHRHAVVALDLVRQLALPVGIKDADHLEAARRELEQVIEQQLPRAFRARVGGRVTGLGLEGDG